MRRMLASIVGVAIATVGILVTIASPDLPADLAGGAVAVVAAGLVGALGLAPNVEATPAPLSTVGRDPISGMRGAFARRSLAREQVVYSVQTLELASGRSPTESLTPDRLRSLLDLPPAAFRAWLESRLDALERET
jgi:hypothetical protein